MATSHSIAGFHFDLENLTQRNGSNVEELKRKHMENLKKELKAQYNIVKFNAALQRAKVANMAKRADALVELNAMSQAEAAIVSATSSAAVEEIDRASVKADSAIAELNDQIFEQLERMADGIESHVKRGLGRTATADQAAYGLATKQRSAAEVAVGDLKRQIANMTETITQTSARGESISALTLERAQLERAKINAEAKLATVEAEVTRTAAAVDRSAAAISRGGMQTAAAKLESLSAKYVVDVEAAWTGMRNFTAGMHQAGEVMTKGYTTYYGQFAQGAEEQSAYWARALGHADAAAASESKMYQKSIAELYALTEGSPEYMAVLSKYATPSSRMIIMTQQSYRELREAEYAFEFMRYIDPRWLGLGIKTAAKAPVIAGLRAGEAILGKEAVSGLAIGAKAIGAVGITALEFLGSAPVQIAIFAAQVGYDFIKDGMSWQFADDVLGIVGLSLEKFGLISQKLQEYPEVTHILEGDGQEPPQIRLMQYDSQEMAMVIDFWGPLYLEYLHKQTGEETPVYKRVKPFQGILKVPGRYIDLRAHPYETDMEVEDNMKRERLIEMDGFAGADFKGRSQVESWYPKKEGFVRNLRAFPLYDSTFQWPDPNRGLPVQMHGNFSRRDIDPMISSTFIKWAENGKYGPAYNNATTREGRDAAIAANKNDLLQYLYPRSDWPTAWQEVAAWVRALRGKKAIMFSDMILLAPEEWLKEWDVDKPVNEWSLLWGYASKYPTNTHMYANAYEEIKHTTGRYTYRPMDRIFLENVVNARQIAVAGYYSWPLYPAPADAIDTFSMKNNLVDGILTPAHGIYVHYRPATDEEVEYFREILNAGYTWKNELDSRKTKTEQEWQTEVLSKIWDDYVGAEQEFRTTWGFVNKYKSFFLEELMFSVSKMAGEKRMQVFADYQKVLTQTHIPLHTNSEHRVAFMGMFAQLAYSDSNAKGAQFISEIEDRFGKILRNDLVTTDKSWKSREGLTHITSAIVADDTALDLPIFFGALNARIFLLDKPRVIVIAIKGTNSKEEWAINLDFTTGVFSSVDHHQDDVNGNSLEIIDDFDTTGKTVTELKTSESLMTVHRGFLRAARALQPGISKTLQHYYDTYQGIQDVFISGHSLGAAITQLMVMMIPRLPVKGEVTPLRGNGRARTTFRNPHAYMFASPKVGDKRFLKQFDLWSGESAQVWIDGDAITAIPPFLVPAKDQSPKAWLSTMRTLDSIGKADSGFAAALSVLRLGYSALSLPPQIGRFFEGLANKDMTTISGLASEMIDASNNNQARRAGGVFLRLVADGSGSFDEATHDIGNTLSVFETISRADDPTEKLLALHSIGNIVDSLVEVAKLNPDLFSLDMNSRPEWRNEGRITDVTVVNEKQATFLAGLAKALEDATARVIGYGKTKRPQLPWTVLTPDMLSSVVMKRVANEDALEQQLRQAAKQRRISHYRDSSYRGEEDY